MFGALSLFAVAFADPHPQTGEVRRGRPPVALCTVPEIDFVAVVEFDADDVRTVTEEDGWRHWHIHRQLGVQEWIWGDRIEWIEISPRTHPTLESMVNGQARAIDFDMLVTAVESACAR
jgi:hypothetical protein